MRSTTALIAIFLVGLALRFLNVNTAIFHHDEEHYVGDATWARFHPIPPGTLHFLRSHPKPHPRLNYETGVIDLWPADHRLNQGHPALYAEVVGLLFLGLQPAWPEHALRVGRTVNAVVDAMGILLLPGLATALGGSPATGLLAAALYASYPPAITYGTIGNIDPPLAPLMLLVLSLLLTGNGGFRHASLLGLATGLLINVKQTGLVALVCVPVAGLLLGRLRVRDLLTWAAVTAVVTTALTDPMSYIDSLVRPTHAMGTLQLTPFATVLGNLDWLAHPSRWYWLSFSFHGKPLSSMFARIHHLLTPTFLVVFAAAFVASVGRWRWRELLVVWLPVALTLAFIPPTNGVWRLHLISPLLCLGAALLLGRMWWWSRIGLVLVGFAFGVAMVLPPWSGFGGPIDFGDLLFMNPASEQPSYFLRSGISVVPDTALTRRYWSPAGRYRVAMDGDPGIEVQLDGQPVTGSTAAIELSGRLHRLVVSARLPATLRSLNVTRED